MANYQFHHTHYICSDLDEMQNFFTEVLGAKLVERKMFGNVEGSVLDFNGTSVYLRRAREGEELGSDPPSKVFGYDHFGLLVDDIDAAYEELTGKGYTFDMKPMGKVAKMAFFRGPDNVSIELFQPPS
jgi:catechol 2,3-dioxygenase-like lactoylglutathione lyase family enzyme